MTAYWQLGIALGMLMLTGMGALAFWVGRLVKAEGATDDIAELKEDHEQLQRDFNDYRVEAAEKYVASSTLMEVEERLTSALNRIADRLDRAIEKAVSRS